MPTLTRTFTRAELTAALTAVDRPDIADGLYSRRMSPLDHVGDTALALDYDDPSDLAIFLIVTAGILDDREAALDFAAALTLGLPGHPADPGPSGAWWPCCRLDEPTWEEWTDDCRACPGCNDPLDRDCPYHPHAPWDVQPARARHLETVG